MHSIVRDRAAFAAAVRTAMAARGSSRSDLARIAEVGERVIGKVLAADPVRDVTALKIARVLDIPVQGTGPDDVSGFLSPGGYGRAAVARYEGTYLTFRPSLDGSSAIRSYVTTIRWSDQHRCLVFEESRRLDAQHSHAGRVFMPSDGSYVYLTSGTHGWVRNITVCQLSIELEMRGTITTLHNVGGPLHLPVVAPIVYRQVEKISPDRIGSFGHADPRAIDMRKTLHETMGTYVRFVGLEPNDHSG